MYKLSPKTLDEYTQKCIKEELVTAIRVILMRYMGMQFVEDNYIALNAGKQIAYKENAIKQAFKEMDMILTSVITSNIYPKDKTTTFHFVGILTDDEYTFSHKHMVVYFKGVPRNIIEFVCEAIREGIDFENDEDLAGYYK